MSRDPVIFSGSKRVSATGLEGSPQTFLVNSISLSQWLNGLNFRLDHMFRRKNKPFKLLSQGPLAEWLNIDVISL